MLVFKGLKIKACNAYVVFNQSTQSALPFTAVTVLWRVDFQACPSMFLPMCVSAHV